MTCISCTPSAAFIPRFTGGISAISSSMIIYIIYISKKRLSTIYHRIMFGMSALDILSSIAVMLTTLPMPNELPFDHPSFYGTRLGNRQTCEAQAFLVVFGYMSMLTYNGMLLCYNACAIAFQMKEEQIVKCAEPFFHLVPLVIGLALATPPLVEGTYNATEKDAWCTLTSSDRFTLVIIFCLMFFGSVIINIILIMRKVYQLELEMTLLQDEIGERNSGLMRAFQSLQNTRVVGKQALAYYLSFMITAGLLFVRALIHGESQVMNYLCLILVPLQGLFNLLIFVFHKVYVYRRVYTHISRLGAIKKLLRKDAEEPILFSRISLLQGPVIELSDEFKSELLRVEKMSGCEVEVDDESHRAEDSLSGFELSLLSNSKDQQSDHNEESKSNHSDSRAYLGGSTSASSPPHFGISIEQQQCISSKHWSLIAFSQEDEISMKISNEDKI